MKVSDLLQLKQRGNKVVSVNGYLRLCPIEIGEAVPCEDEYLYLADVLEEPEVLGDCILLDDLLLFPRLRAAGMPLTYGGQHGPVCYPCEVLGQMQSLPRGLFPKRLNAIQCVNIVLPSGTDAPDREMTWQAGS